MKTKKTWTEKVNEEKQPQLKRVDFDFADIPAGSLMFIATPKMVDKYLKTIPAGRSLSIASLRKDLAIEHKAEYTCPLTTGIFLRIAAEAAYEQYQNGTKAEAISPFWRVIEPGSRLAKKLSFGEEFLIEQRKKEGLTADPKQKRSARAH